MQSRIWGVVVWVWAGTSLFGCAARVADDSRLVEEIARSRQEALVSEQRLAELERRLSEMQISSAQRFDAGAAAAQAQILYRLDLLVAQNQRLLDRSTSISAAEPLVSDSASSPPSSSPALCGEALDPEEQFRRSVERLREDSTRWRGGLTPAQNQAVNVLLRRRRALDPSNPWSS